jgi:hypothetical protein
VLVEHVVVVEVDFFVEVDLVMKLDVLVLVDVQVLVDDEAKVQLLENEDDVHEEDLFSVCTVVVHEDVDDSHT